MAELVLADGDARAIGDLTPRVTTLTRLFTRGDLRVLRGRARDMVLTTGRNALRTVLTSVRLDGAHVDLDISAAGLTWTLPLVRGLPLALDYYAGPPKGTAPPDPATPFADYKGR